MKVLAVLCIAGGLHAQWSDPARGRKIAATVAAHGPPGSPVLIFFPGIGSGIEAYRRLLGSLSGYKVVFVQPQHSLKEWNNAGRLPAAAQMDFERRELKEWVKDGVFVLGRMKARAAGVLGHGAGGLAAAAACQVNPIFRACLNLDGETMGSPFVLDQPFDQPFLWLRPLRETAPSPTAAELKDRQMTRGEYESIMAKSGSASMWISRSVSTMVTLYAKDADHKSFSNGRAGTRAFGLATTVIQEFFDEHMKSRRSLLFSGYATGYSEVVYQQFMTMK